MRSALPLLLLLLVLLAGGAFLLTGGDRRGPDRRLEPGFGPPGVTEARFEAPVGAGTEPASEGAGAADRTARGTEGGAGDPGRRPAGERTTVERGPRRGEPLAFGVRIQLTGAAPEELQGATVTHLEPRSDGADWGDRLSAAAAPEILFEAHGVRYDAGFEGQLYLPRHSHPTYVLARLGERVGYARIDSGRNELELELGDGAPLVVEVRAAGGGLLPELPIALWRDTPRAAEAVWTGLTDESGRVSLPHAARITALFAEQDASFRLGFFFPTRRGRGIPFRPEGVSSGIVALQAPPLGSLTVQVGGEGGGAHTGGASLSLVVVDPGDGAPDLVPHPRFERTVAEGEFSAHFEHLESGLVLELRAHAGGQRGGSRVVEGPAYDGDRRIEILRFGSNAPVLVGSLVDEEGRLVVERRLRFSVEVYDAAGALIKRYPQLRATDAEGGFRVPLRDYYVRGARRVLRVDFQGGDGGEAEAPLPPEIEQGDFAVGRLQLDGVPLLAAGVVLGADGEPLAGAQLHLQRLIGVDAEGRELWVDPLRREFKTDESGAFSIRARSAGEGDLRLTVREPAHLAERVSIESGAADLRVRLKAGGRVRGRVRLPRGAPLEQLLVRLELAERRADDDPRGLAPAPGLPLAEDGSFEAHSLEPGPYTFEVRLLLDDSPLKVVDGLAVRGGEVLEDPRLDVDLSERLAVFRLALRGADGRLDGARVYPVTDGALSDDRRGLLATQGTAVLLARAPELAVDAWAPGHRPQRAEGLEPGERTLRLERGLPVRVRLPDGEWNLPGGTGLELALTPWYGEEPDGPLYVLPDARGSARADSCPWGHPERHLVDSDGEVVLHVPEARTYALTWTIRRKLGRNFVRGALEQHVPQYVQVGEDGAEVTATLTPGDLGRGLAAMK